VFLDEAIALYLRHLQLANRSPDTVRAAREDLTLFREWVEQRHNGPVEPGEVTEEDVASYLLHLRDRGRAPATGRRRLITIRACFGYLRRRGVVPSSPAEDIPLPSLERKLRRHLEPDELERFVREARSPLVKAAAVILYHTGLRVGELCGLRFCDVDFTRRTVRVIGKGRKERVVPLNDAAASALAWYVAEVRPHVNTGYVFVTGSGRLDPDYLGTLIRREAKRLGMEGVTPHAFRHSFATQLLRREVNLLAISALLGHSSPQTTAIYAHVSPQVLEQAVAKLVDVVG
jgi:integrase/recombinase XerD